MKKKLLLGAFLLGSFLTASAQQQTISFESAEGFTLGSINGQNAWEVTQAGEDVWVSNQNVTDAYASDGTYSLQIAADTDYTPQENTIVGAFSPMMTITSDQVEFSFDIYIDEDDDANTDTADLDFYAVSIGEEFVVARVKFFYQGNIVILDEVDTELQFVDTGLTWEADTWYTIRVEIDFTAGTINYYIDDVLAYEGTVFTDVTTVDQISFRNDNYPGSVAYIDNVEVPAGVLGVNEQLVSEFSIYPNPASDVINIANADNILVNGVEIVDLNGRVVKSVNLNGVSQAQINISELSSGMYLMNVASEQGTVTQKIVKK